MSILKALQKKAEEMNESLDFFGDENGKTQFPPPVFKENYDSLLNPVPNLKLKSLHNFSRLESSLKKKINGKLQKFETGEKDEIVNALSKLNSNIYLNLIKQPPHPLVNKLLNNRFRIISLFSDRGGTCQTFLAQDTNKSEITFCIIKKLRPIDDRKEYDYIRSKFNLEASVLHILGGISDQIPELYDFFEENNELYLAQELIEGFNLYQLVQQNSQLDEETVKSILINILEVLEIVHAHQIIHRDIKPENIILRDIDKKPVLIDFGFVKDTFGSQINENEMSSLTVETHGYTSLEQYRGNADFPSDLYSLGATAIYLLTGKPPRIFPLNEFSRLMWEDYAKEVSPEFVQIINKAIQPVQSLRFQTAREMLDVLIADEREQIELIEIQTKIRETDGEKAISNDSNKVLWNLISVLIIGFLMGLGFILIILFLLGIYIYSTN